MNSPHRLLKLCALPALLVFAADQLHKWYMLEVLHIGAVSPIIVTPFFNLVLVWNRGISFGMLSQHDAAYALIALAIVIVLALIWWVRDLHKRNEILAVGLVIGGALGNVVDRFLYGAVADFFDFHIMGYHWPAFNIADSSIFIGVVLLCWESMFPLKDQPSADGKTKDQTP